MRLPDADMQRLAAAAIFNATAVRPGGAGGAAAAGGPTSSSLLRYAANDENPDVVAWSAGTLLNCAAGRGADFAAELLAISPPPVAALVGCLAPDVTDEKYDDAQVALYELQRANAAGALMNLVAVSDGVTAKLLECNGVKALADALAASREDALGACFAAGALANVLLMAPSAAADAIVAVGGAKLMVEALEVPPPPEGAPNSPLLADAQRAACVALLNARRAAALRDELLEVAPSTRSSAASAAPPTCRRRRRARSSTRARRRTARTRLRRGERRGGRREARGGGRPRRRGAAAARTRAARPARGGRALQRRRLRPRQPAGARRRRVGARRLARRLRGARRQGGCRRQGAGRALGEDARQPVGRRRQSRAQPGLPRRAARAGAAPPASLRSRRPTPLSSPTRRRRSRTWPTSPSTGWAPLSPLHSTTSSAAVSMRKQYHRADGAAAEEPDDAPGARSKAAFGTLPAAKPVRGRTTRARRGRAPAPSLPRRSRGATSSASSRPTRGGTTSCRARCRARRRRTEHCEDGSTGTRRTKWDYRINFTRDYGMLHPLARTVLLT